RAGQDGDGGDERGLDDEAVEDAAAIEAPGAGELRGYGAQEEGAEALAVAGGGGVGGGADAYVMAAQVLDEEVVVEHGTQERAAGQAQRARAAVDELVG